MKSPNSASPDNAPSTPNGSGAAAILSAGAGCFALAVLAFAADKSIVLKSALNFYKPTGPLSGVTTAAILFWLFTWGICEWRWSRKSISMGLINAIAFTLLGLSFVLTFPPIVDLL